MVLDLNAERQQRIQVFRFAASRQDSADFMREQQGIDQTGIEQMAAWLEEAQNDADLLSRPFGCL